MSQDPFDPVPPQPVARSASGRTLAVTDAPPIDPPPIDAPVIDAPVIDAPVIDAPVIDASAIDASAVALATHAEQRGRALAAAGWMTLASFFFAVMTVSARLGSSEVPWTEVALARSFFGLAVAIGVARARRVSLRIENARVAWGRSICGTIAMFTTFYTIGAPEIALGDAASLRSTSPVFIALLAPRFLGESSGWRVWVATPISFAGVVLLAKPSFQLASHLAMLCLVAAFFSAIAMMFLRRLGASEAPEAVAAHFSFVATAVMLVAALPGFAAPDGRAWFLLIGTGVSAGLGQLAMTRAYALDHAARVGTIGYLGVVMTQILAAWWLGEIPDALQLAGSALVVGAGVLLAAAALRPARRRPPPLTPPSTR